jgi:hypothetical protein
MAETESLTCYIHPNRETMLRCNRCEQPICTSCAIQTPTGYRCPQCVRSQQKVFNTARVSDLIFAPLLAMVLSMAGSFLVSLTGFFTLLLAPAVGTGIAAVLQRVTGGRRSITLFRLAAAGMVIGTLPLLIWDALPVFYGFGGGFYGFTNLIPLLYQAAYSVLSSGAFYYRFTGIRL